MEFIIIESPDAEIRGECAFCSEPASSRHLWMEYTRNPHPEHLGVIGADLRITALAAVCGSCLERKRDLVSIPATEALTVQEAAETAAVSEAVQAAAGGAARMTP